MFPQRECVCVLAFSILAVYEKNGNWHFLLIDRPKGCFVSGRFVPTDVLSRRTFCLYGRFVPTDVLSLRMFCPYGRFVPWTLCLRLFCLRTFCLRMFCPYGHFVSGHFVWAPYCTLGWIDMGTGAKIRHRKVVLYKLKCC
jgi:hypothetical protein